MLLWRRAFAFAVTALFVGNAVFAIGDPTITTVVASPETQKILHNPERNAYFGDLHLHTALSFDAYAWMGARVYPEDAYRFASGVTINYLGKLIRRKVPLDFLAVTDHAENLGVFNQLEDPESELSNTEVGKLMRTGARDAFFKAMGMMGKGASVGSNAPQVMAAAWKREVDAANAYYQPGKFTTFAAYEWTVNPDNQNLHRNVIFRGTATAVPFTRYDADKPEELWNWMSRIRAQGIEALAIPHNGNVSNGLMWSMTKLDGSPIDVAWARLRAANEPVAEIAQSKGVSETHPVLSPNDEFAKFEIYPWLLAGKPILGKVPGSYWRDALGRGLLIKDRIGSNPYAYGAIGAGDLHSGISASSEEEFGLMGKANVGGGRMNRDEVRHSLYGDPTSDRGQPETTMGSGALTGVWAESNTREAIFAALRRKETFATSGTRIKLRFFAGSYASGLMARSSWVKNAYAKGVPMGGDLVTTISPAFAVQAMKDPDGANLERIQIVKVWVEGGMQKEKIFNIAWAGNRKIDARTGKLKPIGNGNGSVELKAVWRDPQFNLKRPAAYYVRVLEIPTPRWSTLRAREFGLKVPDIVPEYIQERAWSSPIWLSPKR